MAQTTVESGLQDEENQELDGPAAEETATVEETQETVEETQQVDNPQAQEAVKKEIIKKKDYRDMYEKSQKSAEHFRQVNDRRFSETQKTIKALEAQLQKFASYEKLLAQATEAQQKAELEKLAETNPAAYYQKLVELEVAKQAKAQQPQQQGQQEQPIDENYVENVIGYLQQSYGENIYKATEQHMARILTETAQVNPAGYEMLRRQPDALMKLAIGEAYLAEYNQKMQQQQQQKQVATQNQQKALKFASGTAQPQSAGRRQTGTPSNYDSMSDAELEKLKNAELLKKWQQ